MCVCVCVCVCMDKGELNYTITEKYDNYIIVDNVIDGNDFFVNGKIVDDFNIFYKNYIYTLSVSATNNFIELLWSKRMK
jgi:hypothetical protein